MRALEEVTFLLLIIGALVFGHLSAAVLVYGVAVLALMGAVRLWLEALYRKGKL